MKLSSGERWTLAIPLAHLAAAAYLYPMFPNRLASHWNIAGQVDGHLDKFWGLFLMPVVAMGMWLLFLAVPRIDPKRENIEKFRAAFDDFIAALFTFLTYIYSLTLLWNAGIHLFMPQAMPPAVAFLSFSIARLLKQAQPNWSIGIRTPWTLSSPTVWKATHEFGAQFFSVAGVIGLSGVIFPSQGFYLALAPILLAAFASVAYSYILYRHEERASTGSTH